MDTNTLADYLKDRRSKLDPAAFGFSLTRRRTPGLRREEVAQRANVSATWYTWLEQGRGGTPSADVLDRLAYALTLTEVEREHLFLLAQQRPPQVQFREAERITPQLQRVLDSLECSPALVRTAAWDVIAWNRAAATIMGDYSALSLQERNVLRLIFTDPNAKTRMLDWEKEARNAVAGFRADTVRAGASERVTALVEELSRVSGEFASMWRIHDVRSYGSGTKLMRHAIAGVVTFEYSSFSVDGRPDLGLVIFTPATPDDAERIRALLTK
ncbi:MAG: helix-turn-helix transcriptional regulator [Candidatus Aquilonibacter sp.]